MPKKKRWRYFYILIFRDELEKYEDFVTNKTDNEINFNENS